MTSDLEIQYDYPFGDFLIVTAVALATVVALMALVAVLAKKTGKIAVVDVVWGLGFIVVTGVSLLVGRSISPDSFAVVGYGGLDDFSNPFDEQNLRHLLLIVLVTLWGGRLAWHIFQRGRGAGEDPRYEELMSGGDGGLGHLTRKVLLPQGLAIWFVSLPIQVSSVSLDHVDAVLWIGVALWAIGLTFESVGDRQLAAYKADPNRGPVMDKGLWRYTRHPNYFGDACVWWGIFLICASSWPGVFTILSPVAMTYFLVFATGARLLERTMMQRPGYPEYAARTSMFLPLPPRRG